MKNFECLEDFASALEAEMSSDACSALERDEAAFNDWALALFALQFRHNPWYRNYCARVGARPETVTNWVEIPPAPALAFREPGLTCLTPERVSRVFLSSGTTASVPSRHAHHEGSLRLYRRSALTWFHRCLFGGDGAKEGRGFSERPTMVLLTPDEDAAPQSSLVFMLEAVRREWGAADSFCAGRIGKQGLWELDERALLPKLEEFCVRRQPVLLLGTAFNYVQLLDQLSARGMALPLAEGSWAMETGGYKGRTRSLPRAELCAHLRDWLGLPSDRIFSEYGMCELSSQAYGRQGRAGEASAASPQFVFPPWTKVRVLSPETLEEAADGEPGMIAVWDLANAWSVMAVLTGDLGRWQGAGLELLGRASASVQRGCSLMAG